MKNQKYTYKEYQELLKMPLKDKISRANQLILGELKNHKMPCVSCSWGKDSIVLLDLVRKWCKKVLVVFNNTGVEYPQTLEYRDFILKEWQINNYHENKPIKSFFQCVKEYGYPKYRQMAGQGGKERVSAPKCCYYCKEKPFINFIKKFKIDLNFIGLQATESMVRRLSFFREGESFDSKKYDCRIVRPLMIWTDEDIWSYHRLNNIPKNPLYDLMKRNGCMPCTAFKGWQEVMNKANPKLFEYVSKQIGSPNLDCFKEKRDDGQEGGLSEGGLEG